MIGSQAVQVTGVDPLTVSGDANVVAFGTALNGAVVAGSISQANFDLLNDLPDVAALEYASRHSRRLRVSSRDFDSRSRKSCNSSSASRNRSSSAIGGLPRVSSAEHYAGNHKISMSVSRPKDWALFPKREGPKERGAVEGFRDPFNNFVQTITHSEHTATAIDH